MKKLILAAGLVAFALPAMADAQIYYIDHMEGEGETAVCHYEGTDHTSSPVFNDRTGEWECYMVYDPNFPVE